ncbi:MAG TPA: hypothetical protein VGO67_03760 [Verrucomicrobiae bacterium]|jgi:hypothetical protein
MEPTGDQSFLNFHFSTGTLFASLLWGTIGVGFWIYGKKQQSLPAMIGGIGLTAISFLISDPLWMSVSSIAVIAGVYFWSRNG